MPAILHSPTPHARRKVTSRLKSRMGWEMPWYTVTDSFDADFGVDQWHGHNAFIRDGDKAFRTYSVNGRGGHDRGSIGQGRDRGQGCAIRAGRGFAISNGSTSTWIRHKAPGSGGSTWCTARRKTPNAI